MPKNKLNKPFWAPPAPPKPCKPCKPKPVPAPKPANATIRLLNQILEAVGKANDSIHQVLCGGVNQTHLKKLERKIMATQAEVVEELKTVKTTLGKIKTEVTDAKDELLATIKRLEEVIAGGNTGGASAELIAIKDELVAEVKTLDDLHLDRPTSA